MNKSLTFCLLLSLLSISSARLFAQEPPAPPPAVPPDEVAPPLEPPPPPPCAPAKPSWARPGCGPWRPHPFEPLRQWLRRKDPARLAHLERLRTENPAQFRRELRKCLRMFAEEMHPEMKTQLELQRTEWREVRNLAQQYRATTNELERTAIQQQLRAKLTAIFETRQALRRKELERLAQRIEELKNAVESREHNKDILIEQQLKAVIGGCGTTDW